MKIILKYGLLGIPSLVLCDTMFVKEDVNIRKNPSIASEIVEIYKKNTPIDVKNKIFTQNDGTWYQIEKGFISAELVVKTRENRTSIKENIIDNIQYVDARKNSIIVKDLFIDAQTDTVYTLIPKELLPKKEKQNNIDQKKIHGSFEYAKLFENEKEDKKQDNQILTQKEINSYKDYFVGFSLGYTYYAIDKTNQVGSITLNTPNNKATSLKIQGGKYINNYALALNYQKDTLDDLDTNSLYFSLDYNYPYFYNIYAGITLGYIQGEWNNDLLVNSAKTKDQNMASYLYGIQTGIKYSIKTNLDFISQLSYQKFELETDLISTPAKSNIMIDDRKSLEVGVRVGF